MVLLVKIVKQILRSSSPAISFMHYRSTPTSVGHSPAQLLINRQIRTKIPSLVNKVPRIDVERVDNHRHRNMKSSFDKAHGARQLTDLNPARRVLIVDLGKTARTQIIRCPTPKWSRTPSKSELTLPFTISSFILGRARRSVHSTPTTTPKSSPIKTPTTAAFPRPSTHALSTTRSSRLTRSKTGCEIRPLDRFGYNAP